MARGLKAWRIVSGTAAILAGLVLMGAGPGPSTPTAAQSDAERLAAANAAILKVFPTPRLYHMAITGNAAGQMDGIEMCFGAAIFAKFAGAFVQDSKATAELSKGCTQTLTHNADGSMRVEITCGAASGLGATHMVIEGTVKDIHQHMEVSLNLGEAQPRTLITDMHMTEIGECPAGMTPGQMRKPDGAIIDPLGDLMKTDADAKGNAPAKE